MQSGRQSHINQKSKEAWFYEHLPVPTSYRLIFYWLKFATEPYIRDALVAVLQISLNFYIRDILIGVLMYTKYAHGQLRWSEKRGTSVFWNMRQLTVKKRNDTSLTHKAKLKITVCPYVCTVCYVYLLIFIEWQAYLPFQRIGKNVFVCFKLVFTIYVYTPREYNLVSPTDASSNVKHTTIILSYVPICFLLMTGACLMLAYEITFLHQC